ncbi:MAG TPA: hypothetical protein PLW70_06360, partial [Bacteroidales bacterium]|nr:hypothetical protein [Bacteroidales bacterium]
NGYDSAVNFSSAHNAFYTSRINHFTRDTIIIGTNTTIATFIQYQTITPILGEYSWSCMLYNVADYTKYGGVIKSIAWEQAPYPQGPYTYKNQKIYMYAVKATEPPSVYQDAFAKGWQLVYEDSIVFTQSGGWVNMTLSSPFYLPPGYNLYIQNENRNNDAPTNHIPFYYTSAPNTFRGASAGAMFPGYGGTISGYRTNLRLIIDPVNYDSNSVMLYSVNQPSVESVVSRDSAVIVQIKNMGIKNLSSTSINWSINGVVQTPYTWNHATTGIPEGFLSDTIHIGYYNPIEAIDTLKFWVSLPNGEIDSVTADDTLRYTLNACTGMLNGEYVIGGDTGDFPTIRTAINTLYFCGMSGNVTFKISNGEYATQGYNVLLEFMEPITGMGANDTLFITSATGRAEDVIICPYTLGCGTYLKDVRNIVFTNLTFSTKNQIYNNRAVDIATGCSNIEFSHCVFDITRLTPGQTDGSAFWVPVSSAPVNGLRINYNTFLGAYDCIYIGSSNSNRTNNVEIIGNQMLNCHRSGVYNGGSYVDFKKISHNYITINPNSTVTTLSGIRVAAGRADEINNNIIIIPSTAATTRTVYGIYFATATNYIKEIKNNKIRITNATTSNGMYLAAMNVASATDTNETLIANNEIISDATGTNYGIYATSNYKTHFYHNSVYISGAGTTSRAFYEATTASTGTLKNNIIVNMGGTPTATGTYAVYFNSTSASNWDINYNTYYSIGTNLAYGASAARIDLASWKTAVPQDSNSISVLPPFVNINKNLVLRAYTGFECPLLPIVTSELRGFPRDTLNYMGCYTNIQLAYNLTLTRFVSPPTDVLVTGNSTPLTMVMENKGDSTITNVKIAWKHNGILKKTISWTGNLAKTDTSIIYLDTIIPIAGENNIQVYSYLPNGEDDEYPDNDTIVGVVYGCDSALRGTYSVG